MARVINQAVAVGSPSVIPVLGLPLPITVHAVPGPGGTLAVEYSCTDSAVANPGAANWSAWPAGTVSASASDSIVSPVVAIRVTAATAAGSVEVVAS
jgi:hypothetical protein